MLKKIDVTCHCYLNELHIKVISKMMSKQTTIKNLITNFSVRSKEKPFAFLNHVDYFKDDNTNEISSSSISKKWTALTGENSWSTYAKGYAVIHGANVSEESKGCPYKNYFSSSEMMRCSKHSRDTGIVNKDGSINLDKLESVMNIYFEEYESDSKENKLILKQSKMNEYLEECDKRDNDLPATGPFYVSYKTIAKGEWDTFFSIFSDFIIGTEKCITAETFLLFYFDSETLYQRQLDKMK